MKNDLDNLEDKIKEARGPESAENSSINALHAGMEFTAPIIGGIIIGYFLDGWLETKPVFILSLFLLGVAAGFVNIYKASQNIGGTVGFSELHKREKDVKTSQNEKPEQEKEN
jgi:ATP synthase protein I